MEILPTVQAARFEQLEAGDLFIYFDKKSAFFALKTQQLLSEGRSGMVLLGPKFPEGIMESLLLTWQAATVLSLGKNFSVLPSLDPTAWSTTEPTREPVWLAVADEKIYVCTNGGPLASRFFPCFVELGTGAVIEGQLPGIVAFTKAWEIVVLSTTHPPRSVLKYSLPQ